MDIQIFERNVKKVRAVQAAQGVECGSPGTAVTDPFEISFDVHSEILS